MSKRIRVLGEDSIAIFYSVMPFLDFLGFLHNYNKKFV